MFGASGDPIAMKAAERREARVLRSEHGQSITCIARTLGVAPSSVSRWVRDIELSSEQQEALRAGDPARNGRGLGQATIANRAREVRRHAQAHGRRLARGGDSLHLSGCMLFWAEGSKDPNSVVFTNADADMVAFFVRFLRTCYEVKRTDILLSCNVFLDNGLSLEEIEGWWLARLDLPPTSLRKAAVNRTSRASARKRRTLPLGTARIVVHSTFVLQSIYGALQAYAGLTRPRWLR